ncbi:hypothetical protein IBTHAUMO2_280003 [Nitrosopumilaceae archaeon]|nr:hypothetical protein IBTHAUMO2_280003 [Nitrosopumilaceae archaeon]
MCPMYERNIGIPVSIAVPILAVTYLFMSQYYALSNSDLVVIQTVITLGFSGFIWYITTRTPRENRNFVRRKLARSYENLASRADHMRTYPSADQIGKMRGIYCSALHTMEIHASSLPADEIETISDWWESLEQRLLLPLEKDPSNPYLLDQLAEEMSTQMKAHITKYGIPGYREYFDPPS